MDASDLTAVLGRIAQLCGEFAKLERSPISVARRRFGELEFEFADLRDRAGLLGSRIGHHSIRLAVGLELLAAAEARARELIAAMVNEEE